MKTSVDNYQIKPSETVTGRKNKSENRTLQEPKKKKKNWQAERSKATLSQNH